MEIPATANGTQAAAIAAAVQLKVPKSPIGRRERTGLEADRSIGAWERLRASADMSSAFFAEWSLPLVARAAAKVQARTIFVRFRKLRLTPYQLHIFAARHRSVI